MAALTSSSSTVNGARGTSRASIQIVEMKKEKKLDREDGRLSEAGYVL